MFIVISRWTLIQIIDDLMNEKKDFKKLILTKLSNRKNHQSVSFIWKLSFIKPLALKFK